MSRVKRLMPIRAGHLALSVGLHYWQGSLLWQARSSWRENGPTKALFLQSGGGLGRINTKPRSVLARYMRLVSRARTVAAVASP